MQLLNNKMVCLKSTTKVKVVLLPCETRKKARATLQGSPKKTLIFHYAILGELRAKYKATKANKDKKAFVNILSGNTNT